LRDPDAALAPTVFEVLTDGPEATEVLGEAWGRVILPGTVLLLEGDLGAGKTTLVRGLARGLGIDRGVKSPTFAIHLVHAGRLTLHHLDLYRIQDPGDLVELGLGEAFESEGISVVEWGDRLGDQAPPDAVSIRFEEPGPERRRLRVSGPAERVAPLAAAAHPGGRPE
jgi:tRNA threonylcarbamoyladenosine biosynthesis protein TsaE